MVQHRCSLFLEKLKCSVTHSKNHSRVVVREGKRLPFYVVEKAVFNVSLGANAGVAEIEGSTIPAVMEQTCSNSLRFAEEPVVIMVVGAC